MENWSDLKAAVASIVKTNGYNEITGQLLQNVLNNIISNVGMNATFAGIATPSTNPGMPDGPVFYFAIEAGTYSNFGGILLDNPGLVVLYNSTDTWNSLKVYECLQGLGSSTNSTMSQKAITEAVEANALAIAEEKAAIIGTGRIADLAVTLRKLDTSLQDTIQRYLSLSQGIKYLSSGEFDFNDTSLIGNTYAVTLNKGAEISVLNAPDDFSETDFLLITTKTGTSSSFIFGITQTIISKTCENIWTRISWGSPATWSSWCKIVGDLTGSTVTIDNLDASLQKTINSYLSLSQGLKWVGTGEFDFNDTSLIGKTYAITVDKSIETNFLNAPTNFTEKDFLLITTKTGTSSSFIFGITQTIISYTCENIWTRISWGNPAAWSSWCKIVGDSVVTSVDTTQNLPVMMFDSILFLGDSVTHGNNAFNLNGQYYSYTNYDSSYPTLLKKIMPWITINNKAKGGYTAKQVEDEILPTCDCTEDMCVIELGWNLVSGKAFNDTYDTDVAPYDNYNDYADTNMGSYCRIIEKIKEKNPNIVIVLVCSRGWENHTSTSDRIGAVKRIAQEYNLPLIDFTDHELYPVEFTGVDKVHSTIWGYGVKAEYFIKGLGIALKEHNDDISMLWYKQRGKIS